MVYMYNSKNDQFKMIKIKRGMKWEIDTHTAYKAALSDDNKLIKKNWGVLVV